VSKAVNVAVPVVVPLVEVGVTVFETADGALIPKALLAVVVQV
jgi:hypothetical protein